MKTYIHTDGRVIREDELKEITLPKVGDRLMFKGDNFFRVGQNAGEIVEIVGTRPITIEDEKGSIGYISLEEFASAFEPIDYAAHTDELEKLAARREELMYQYESERDNWEKTAADFARSTTYYRNLLVECGEAIGKEAYTCDDGTVQQDVLVAKVPELVRGLSEKREDTADLIYDIMRDEVNVIDECEKWLRAYAPGKLRKAYEADHTLPVVGDILRHKRYGWDKRVEGLTQFTIELERGGQVQKLGWMEDWGIVTPEPPAAYPPPESEWPEKPAPPEGCEWVRQPNEGVYAENSDVLVLTENGKGGVFWRQTELPGSWDNCVVFRAEPIDHTEGGKYRMLEVGEVLREGDAYLEYGQWVEVQYSIGNPLVLAPGQFWRRPVKPDYAQQAKDILQRQFGAESPFRKIDLDNFVDLVIKAARQEACRNRE